MLIALMTVGPERVYALSVEAQAHAAYAKAVAAGVMAQAVPGEFSWSYDYDDNGNLESTTKRDSTGTVVKADGYTYDGENRLATHSLGGALDVTYAYDADGIRTWSKKAGADPTYFLTDKNRPYAQVIEERTWLDPADPDNPDPEDALLAVRYTYGDDLIAQDRVIDPAADPLATTRSYYHYDGQLSTRMLTDAQADPDTPSTAPPTVTDTYTYDAFGNLLDSTTADGTPAVNNYRYTGEQYDPNLGFYYLRARYYDQAVGRFLTVDPVRGDFYDPSSLHRYLYVHANPINAFDPTGLFWTLVGQLARAAINFVLRKIDAIKVYAIVTVFRVVTFFYGGVLAWVTKGQSLLRWIAGGGRRAIQAMQNVFMKFQGTITQAEAEAAPRYSRTVMNRLITGVQNNPPNIAWHHIVEQGGKNLRNLQQAALQSMANVVPMPKTIHDAISIFYSTKHVALPGFRRFRDWMYTLSWEEQYRYGLEIFQNAMQNAGSITWKPPV